MSPQPKLVIFDLDGTLAESKTQVTVDMGARLARLLEKFPVAVMSGGAFHQFEKQLLPALPQSVHFEQLYLFPVSASQCYRYQSGNWETLYDLAFSVEEKARVLAALHESLEETGFANPPEKVWGERIEDRGAQITFSALGQQAPYTEKKTWDPTREKRMPIKAALDKKIPDFNVAVNATTSIDINRKGVTKAYGIQKLSEMTGIQVADMLYVGDALFPGGNDEVVVPTGVPTRPIATPEETAKVIEELVGEAS